MTRFALAPMLLLASSLGACAPDVTSPKGLAWVARGSPVGIAEAGKAMRDPRRASKSLLNALGEAMQVAPERVLPLVGTGEFLTVDICLPQGWGGADWREMMLASRKAVASVRDPALAAQRGACLAHIDGRLAKLDRQRSSQ